MKSRAECLLIDLDNFESQEAINSPYVLTSPRSLKACKKAGIKPVELLYRTCQEIATELGISINHVRNIHQQQETERQRKLELCRKVRNELKNKQSRFHFFQRKSQASKYIHKGNNAKQKPPPSFAKHRVTLVTDSDESRRNLQMPYPTTLDVPSITTSTHMSTSYDERRKQIELTRTDECRTEVYHPRPPCCNTVPSASSPESFKCRPISYAGQNQASYTQPRSSPAQSIRKYSDTTVTNDFKSSNSIRPRSLENGENPKMSFEMYQAAKSNSNVRTPTNSKSKHKRNDASDSCASISSLTPDPVQEKYTKTINLTPNLQHTRERLESGFQIQKDDMSKDSEHGNTSTTSSDKENEKISKRVKLKSKENRVDMTRKNHGLPISLRSHEETQNPPGIAEPKKRLRFKKDTSVNSDSSSSASSKKTTASTGDLRKKYRTKMKQLPDLSHVSLLPPMTHSEGFYNHNISLQDRRILESMALKKREDLELEQRALEAHRLWEEDRKSLDRKQEKKREEWKSYVEEKRKLEQNVNTMRMEEAKENLRQAQALLETRLRERNKRIEEVIHNAEHKKIRASSERKENLEKKRFLVEANHLQKELERIMQYEECEHELSEKLRRAEKLRQRGLRNFHQKVSTANKVEELRHQERMQELLEEERLLRDEKLKEIQGREDKVIQRYMEQVRYKLEAIKRNSLNRELKSQQAKQTVRDLEEGLETWQDHVMLMQWDALRRSEANAKLLLANRRLRVECENKERMIQHSRRYREKKMDESRKLRSIIEEIRNKEEKIKCLQRTRERDVTECKLRAHSAAELREQIRNTLTPETFDRKVSRVNMELRISSRPPSASPTLMRSHIRLG